MSQEGTRQLGASIQQALARKDWCGALELVERWCLIYPAHAPGWFWRASCLARLGRFPGALDCVRRARRLDEDDDRFARLEAQIEAAAARAGQAAMVQPPPQPQPQPQAQAPPATAIDDGGGGSPPGVEPPVPEQPTPAPRSPAPPPATALDGGGPPPGMGVPTSAVGPPPSGRTPAAAPLATQVDDAPVPAPPADPAPGRADPPGTLVGGSPDADVLAASVPTPGGLSTQWREGSVVDGRYEVRGVARGGMGEVYFVFDRELDLDIAVKTPLPATMATDAGRGRFLREAEAWIGLGLHPNICSAYYVRATDGVPRLFIEYVDGGSLDDWLRERRDASAVERLDIAVQIASGMHHAHTFEWKDEEGKLHRGLVHRDLKPANVLVDRDGRARVTDFGLVGRTGGEPEAADEVPDTSRAPVATPTTDGVWATITLGGSAMGTPPYMAPEQWTGAHAAGPAADVYAFGCILYELFCDRRPLTVDPRYRNARPEVQRLQWERVHREAEPPDPRELDENVDGELAALMVRCLAKDPSDRPSDFADLGRALREAYVRIAGTAYPRPEPRAGRLLADALSNRGVSYAALGRAERAEEAWRQALAADPHHIEASFNLALYQWRRLGAGDAAVAHRMTEVCRTQSASWRAAYLAGSLALSLGDFTTALERLRAALVASAGGAPEVARRCAVALCAVAEQSSDPALWREAASLLARVGGALRTDPLVLTTYALALDRLGEADKASRLYAEARRHRDDLPPELSIGARRLLPGLYLVRRLTAFVGRATAAVVSHDGRVGLVRAEDGGLCVLDTSSGEVVRTLRPDGASPRCLAVEPEGRTAFTAADGEPVSMWNLAAGMVERRLLPHSGFINALAVSADGRRLAGVGSTGALTVWELGPSPQVRALPSADGFCTCVAWAADGRTVAVGAGDGVVRVHDVADERVLATVEGHRGPVTAVHLSRGARHVVTGGEDGCVRLWDLRQRGCTHTLTGHQGGVPFVTLAEDGRSCLSASADGSLRLWDLTRGEPRQATVLEGGVLAGAATPDWGTVLLAHGPTVTQLDLREDAEYRTPWAMASPVAAGEAEERAAEFRRHLESARRLADSGEPLPAFAEVEQARAVSGYERVAEALDLASRIAAPFPHAALSSAWEERVFSGHGDRITAVAVTAGGGRLLTAGSDRRLVMWDIESGEELQVFGQSVIELALAATGDGRSVVSAGLDNVLRVWDLPEGGCVRTLEGHEAKVFALALDEASRRVVSASADQSARLWSTDGGRCLHVLTGHDCQVLCAATSPDGGSAVTGGDDGSLVVWDLEKGVAAVGLSGHSGSVHDVAWSGDGRLVISASRDGTVRVWDAARGSSLRTIDDGEPQTAVAVSPDGQHVLVGTGGGTVKLWEVRSRECVRTFSGHGGAVTAVVFSPEGRRAVTASVDGTARVWYLDWRPEIVSPADWDDRARPYLEVFLARHAKGGRPQWTDDEFRELVGDLARRGLGWLRPAGVKAELETMVSKWDEAPVRAAVARPRAGIAPATPTQRRQQRLLKRLVAAAVVAAIPVAAVLAHRMSRLDLRLHKRTVAESRRVVFESVMPTPPEIARNANCDRARASLYVQQFTEYTVDEWDRMAARHCLEVISDPETVAPLLNMLRPKERTDPYGRTLTFRDPGAAPDVLSILTRMGDDATDEIADAIADPDRTVRSIAASVLALRSSELSIEALVLAAESPDADARIAVSRTLREVASSGRLGVRGSFALFESMAGDQNPVVRRDVATGVAIFRGRRAVALATALARDPDEAVRTAARATLAKMEKDG